MAYGEVWGGVGLASAHQPRLTLLIYAFFISPLMLRPGCQNRAEPPAALDSGVSVALWCGV